MERPSPALSIAVPEKAARRFGPDLSTLRACQPISKQTQTIDWAGGKGTVVDFTGTDKAGQSARLIGVIAPKMDQTWFFKLMGDPQIVEQQKDAFTKFIQSEKFSNAP